jgi:peptidoglycan/LPS O-acetylase OafA/YrhL
MRIQSPESRNLDLLRAAAVLFVFGSHLILTLTPNHHVYDAVHTPWVALLYTLGNIGVLLFFVHTSLVLLLSLERTRPSSLFSSFYIRRFFRIYPLSIVCILIVLSLRIPYVPELAFIQPGWRDIVSNLLLVQNLTHANSLISPLWTLPLEVQMYAILPLIFVLLRWKGSVPLVLILWGIAAIAARRVPLLAYVPCFLGGVFAYQISRGKTYRLPASLWPLAILSLVAVRLWFGQNTGDVDRASDYVRCMIVGALIPHFNDLIPSWLTRACHIVALYSYSIYLFHLPVIWFAFVKLRCFPAWFQWVSLSVLICVIPWMAYTWLEAPLIESGRRIANQLSRREKQGQRVPVTL